MPHAIAGDRGTAVAWHAPAGRKATVTERNLRCDYAAGNCARRHSRGIRPSAVACGVSGLHLNKIGSAVQKPRDGAAARR